MTSNSSPLAFLLLLNTHFVSEIFVSATKGMWVPVSNEACWKPAHGHIEKSQTQRNEIEQDLKILSHQRLMKSQVLESRMRLYCKFFPFDILTEIPPSGRGKNSNFYVSWNIRLPKDSTQSTQTCLGWTPFDWCVYSIYKTRVLIRVWKCWVSWFSDDRLSQSYLEKCNVICYLVRTAVW